MNGTRFGRGNTQKTPLLRQCGNRALCAAYNLLYGVKLTDVTCGMNGYRKAHIEGLGCVSDGMEFSIEVRARSALAKAAVREVSLTCRERVAGISHLRMWADGWLHLKMLIRVRYA